MLKMLGKPLGRFVHMSKHGKIGGLSHDIIWLHSMVTLGKADYLGGHKRTPVMPA